MRFIIQFLRHTLDVSFGPDEDEEIAHLESDTIPFGFSGFDEEYD